MTRRESFVGHTVAYAAVGASQAADLLRFPPEGSTSFAEELRLGSGADRFLLASSTLMTWGVQRLHGIEVVETEAGDGGQYAGISFNADGIPQPTAPEDLQFSSDGSSYLRAGSVVDLRWPDERQSLKFRVVYTLDESNLSGFAMGSADEFSVPGEVLYTVELREDDSVWATVRGFLFPNSTGLLGWKGRNEIRAIVADVKAQLSMLAPGAGVSPTNGPEAQPGDVETDTQGGVDDPGVTDGEIIEPGDRS